MTHDRPSSSSVGHAMLWPGLPARVALEPAEVQVLAFDLDLPEPETDRLARLLSDDEMARAARLRYAQHRQRYVAGRARLRSIIARYAQRDAARLTFRYGEHGKPALQSGSTADPIRFNLSRSGAVGVVAIQLGDDVGVDIEHVRPFSDALEIARRLFAVEEHRVLRSLPAAERSAAFFRYWTRKEAVVKSIGRGLSLRIDTFPLARDPGGSTQRVDVPDERGTVITRWTLPIPDPCEGYVVALATAGSPRPMRCWTWAD